MTNPNNVIRNILGDKVSRNRDDEPCPNCGAKMKWYKSPSVKGLWYCPKCDNTAE